MLNVTLGVDECHFAYFKARNFRGFADFWQIREIFRTEASARVYSREIRESWVIYDAISKND